MSGILTPNPRRGSGRAPDHSGIRLPLSSNLRRRFVPQRPAPRRGPLGGPPLRAA